MGTKRKVAKKKPGSKGIPIPQGQGKIGFPLPTFRAPDASSNIRSRLQVSKGPRVYTNTAFDHLIARRICERLMLKESLQRICRDPKMPRLVTVVRWLADPKLPEFREMYYYAKRVGAELLVDEMHDIADDVSKDWKDVYDNSGEFIRREVNNEAVQRSKIRIDTRKWLAAKMVPRLYGDNVSVDLTATGDLAELIKKAANKDRGLPPPIDV